SRWRHLPQRRRSRPDRARGRGRKPALAGGDRRCRRPRPGRRRRPDLRRQLERSGGRPRPSERGRALETGGRRPGGKRAAGRQRGRVPWGAGGGVWVGARGGDLCALDAADGPTRWTTGTGPPATGSPILAGDRVYVGTEAGGLVGVDARRGAVRYEYRTGRNS